MVFHCKNIEILVLYLLLIYLTRYLDQETANGRLESSCHLLLPESALPKNKQADLPASPRYPVNAERQEKKL